MTLQEIKEAVDNGKTVYWENGNYTVVKNDKNGEYFIKASNGYCIGLTWADGKTLNGKEEEFFTLDK